MVSGPFDIREAFAAGVRHHQAGRLADAESAYKRILAFAPDHPDALHLLGVAASQRGGHDVALSLIGRAIALTADRPVAAFHKNIAIAFQARGQRDEAIGHLRSAIAIAPKDPDSHGQLAALLQERGKIDEAVASWRNALALTPNHPAALGNLGGALLEQGAIDEAVECCRRAAALAPNFPDAHYNLALALRRRGWLEEAASACRRALVLRPDFAEAHATLGVLFKEQGRLDEAESALRQALTLRPHDPETQVNLGAVLQEQGHGTEAVAELAHALARNPNLIEARLAVCMAQLPPIAMSEDEMAAARRAYANHLGELSKAVGTTIPLRDFAEAIGTSQPFYLAYQGRNDRELQSLYGDMVCRASAGRFPPAPLAAPPDAGEKIRVGIVSGFFWNHSNWKLPIKGWLTKLDRTRFELFGYHTGTVRDSATEEAASCCRRFVEGPLTVEAWRTNILADAPHVLIYPEIGMNRMSLRLAAQRLAPVQCNSWGHPDTSGLSTMDYYLSSDLMEPANAQDHYSERLVRLPNLSVYWEPAECAEVSIDRRDLGLRPGAIAYWCGQSLVKYLPQFDDVFPRIAQAVGDCQFVFLAFARSPHVTTIFRERLGRAFARCGLKADEYCVFLPPLTPDRFVAAIGQCDVILDSIEWSGCNSTLESIVHHRPIVAMIGQTMRGRHTSAILSMMGVTETIAKNPDDYVSIAARLAREPGWRASVANRMAAGTSPLLRDRTCIAALEAFLEGVAARRSNA